MAPVGAYLRKLLFQYDCVVVPELGGFLTHYQPAQFVSETGQYLPPRKRLAFNEALRLDDGILIHYIMLHESLSREEASRMINDFVADLKQHVQLAGSFSVDGIGLFTPNVEGKLQFDPELRHNFFGESFGMSVIQAEKISTVPVELVEAEEVTPIYALGPVLQEEVLEVGPFVRVSRPRPLLRWAAAAALVGSLGAISYLSVIEPGQPMESSLSPANWFRVPAWLQTNLQNNGATTKEIAMATPAKRPAVEPRPAPVSETAAAPVPETSVVPPVVENNSVATEPAKTESAKVVVEKTKPVAKTEVAKPLTPVNSPVSETKKVSTAETSAPKLEKKEVSGPLFTVIAGSFASKPNALRFRRTLRKAGYTDAFIMMPSREGGLYKVAAIGSPVREEAIASTDSLQKLTGIAPFIIRN